MRIGQGLLEDEELLRCGLAIPLDAFGTLLRTRVGTRARQTGETRSCHRELSW